MKLTVLLSFSCFLLVHAHDEEYKLMEHLFGGKYNNSASKYAKIARPTLKKSSPVNMTFGIAYVQLVQLDDREQTLISNVWIRQRWYNHLLTWSPGDYSNITIINVDPLRVWKPDIVLYNNAKSGLGAGTMYRFKTKIKLHHNGLNEWFAPTIIRSSCNIDITFFPFDDQLCELQFGSWTYTGRELDIYRDDRETADLAFYLESAEFDLISAKATRRLIPYSCCPGMPYPNIFFTIHIRRQPGFFLFNVIIPSMVITFFAILTFSSPHHVGERISLAIESFLSLSFLCLMVADSIPVNSDISPLITKFLIACMTMISSALVLNLVSMNLCSNKPVPKWLRNLAFVYIGPCLGFCGGLKLGQSKLRNKIMKKLSVISNGGGKYVTPHLHETILSRIQNPPVKDDFVIHQMLCRNKLIPIGSSKVEFDKVKADMNDIIDRSNHEINHHFNKDFWRCLAQTADRICVITFSLSFVFVSAVMLLKGYGHQLKVQNG